MFVCVSVLVTETEFVLLVKKSLIKKLTCHLPYLGLKKHSHFAAFGSHPYSESHTFISEINTVPKRGSLAFD